MSGDEPILGTPGNNTKDSQAVFRRLAVVLDEIQTGKRKLEGEELAAFDKCRSAVAFNSLVGGGLGLLIARSALQRGNQAVGPVRRVVGPIVSAFGGLYVGVILASYTCTPALLNMNTPLGRELKHIYETGRLPASGNGHDEWSNTIGADNGSFAGTVSGYKGNTAPDHPFNQNKNTTTYDEIYKRNHPEGQESGSYGQPQGEFGATRRTNQYGDPIDS
eukprot:Nk52_evm1s455 gene=Nk52_evmTU1s455